MPDALPTAPESARPPEVAAPETPPPRASEGIRARDAALEMPSIVEQALLTRPVKLHGVTVSAYSFDVAVILRNVGNPLSRGRESQVPDGADEAAVMRAFHEWIASFTPLQIAQVVFAAADPATAAEVAAPPTGDESFTEFDREALKFLRERSLQQWHVVDIFMAIIRLYLEGLAAAPGAGASNPPKAGPA